MVSKIVTNFFVVLLVQNPSSIISYLYLSCDLSQVLNFYIVVIKFYWSWVGAGQGILVLPFECYTKNAPTVPIIFREHSMAKRKIDKFKLIAFVFSVFCPAISQALYNVDDMISASDAMLLPFKVVGETVCGSIEPCKNGISGLGSISTAVPFSLTTSGMSTIDLTVRPLYRRLAMAKDDSLQYLATNGSYVTSNLDGAVAAYRAENPSVSYRSAVFFIATL